MLSVPGPDASLLVEAPNLVTDLSASNMTLISESALNLMSSGLTAHEASFALFNDCPKQEVWVDTCSTSSQPALFAKSHAHYGLSCIWPCIQKRLPRVQNWVTFPWHLQWFCQLLQHDTTCNIWKTHSCFHCKRWIITPLFIGLHPEDWTVPNWSQNLNRPGTEQCQCRQCEMKSKQLAAENGRLCSRNSRKSS